jgi:hypothetical protein
MENDPLDTDRYHTPKSIRLSLKSGKLQKLTRPEIEKKFKLSLGIGCEFYSAGNLEIHARRDRGTIELYDFASGGRKFVRTFDTLGAAQKYVLERLPFSNPGTKIGHFGVIVSGRTLDRPPQELEEFCLGLLEDIQNGKLSTNLGNVIIALSESIKLCRQVSDNAAKFAKN